MCGMNEVDSARIQKEIESLAQVQASGMTGFQEKFKVRNCGSENLRITAAKSCSYIGRTNKQAKNKQIAENKQNGSFTTNQKCQL